MHAADGFRESRECNDELELTDVSNKLLIKLLTQFIGLRSRISCLSFVFAQTRSRNTDLQKLVHCCYYKFM